MIDVTFGSPQPQKRYSLRSVLTILLGLVGVNSFAQRSVDLSAEAGQYMTSNVRTPFWLRTNQHGIVPLTSPNTTLRLGAWTDYDSTRLTARRITFGGGVQVVANTASSALRGNLLLPELYAKVRWRSLELYVGRRREVLGLLDSTLSSGSYAWSGNALPVPKIQLEIREYAPLKFTKGWVSLKGNFAHGWLGGQFVQHTMLHQKALYGRLGKAEHRFHAYGGINHLVVWGGYSKELIGSGLVTSAYLPSGFRDYLSLVTGLRAVNSGVIDQTKYTDFDLTNRVGNHLGSVDIAFDYETDKYSFYLYRQNPYETGALFYGVSLADGLNGFRVKVKNERAIIRQVLVEVLNTTSQGGPEFVIEDPKLRGRVDYFNHSQFRDGWSYRAQTIGTPFINPALGPNGEAPYGGYTNNNRVQVTHFGLAGTLPLDGLSVFNGPVTYETKLSISNNRGTYRNPYLTARRQVSGIVTVAAPLNLLGGLQVTGSLAWDSGTLYRQAIGGYLGIRKTWSNQTRARASRGQEDSGRSFPGRGGVRE